MRDSLRVYVRGRKRFRLSVVCKKESYLNQVYRGDRVEANDPRGVGCNEL